MLACAAILGQRISPCRNLRQTGGQTAPLGACLTERARWKYVRAIACKNLRGTERLGPADVVPEAGFVVVCNQGRGHAASEIAATIGEDDGRSHGAAIAADLTGARGGTIEGLVTRRAESSRAAPVCLQLGCTRQYLGQTLRQTTPLGPRTAYAALRERVVSVLGQRGRCAQGALAAARIPREMPAVGCIDKSTRNAAPLVATAGIEDRRWSRGTAVAADAARTSGGPVEGVRAWAAELLGGAALTREIFGTCSDFRQASRQAASLRTGAGDSASAERELRRTREGFGHTQGARSAAVMRHMNTICRGDQHLRHAAADVAAAVCKETRRLLGSRVPTESTGACEGAVERLEAGRAQMARGAAILA
jgi:hypothetical protein